VLAISLHLGKADPIENPEETVSTRVGRSGSWSLRWAQRSDDYVKCKSISGILLFKCTNTSQIQGNLCQKFDAVLKEDALGVLVVVLVL
jgi:hypothetical protein